MRRLRTFAMRLTLVVTLVTGAAVLLVSIAHMALEVQRARNRVRETVGAQARVIAANSTAALDFDDADAARETLRGLAGVPEFAAAEVWKAGHTQPFALYIRQPAESLPDPSALRPGDIEGRWLAFVQPILRDGERIGELRLLYDFGPLRRRLLGELIADAAIGLFTVGLAFLAARRVQRSLLRPVRELATAAEAIAAADDLSIRAKKVSSDELGALTDIFNSMIERLGEAEVIRRNHRQLLEEEVARRTAEVMETQARLRQSERMASLGTLSAGLGHDIGNILMPLRSHLAYIQERSGADEGDPDFAAIARATEYLQNLSASLRLFADDQHGATLQRDPTPLAPWWAHTEPLLRAMMGRGIALEHELPEHLPPVMLSQSLLMQAVFNLVQNAAQALKPESAPPPEGARIVVAAAAAPDAHGEPRVAISVSDNGPGMTEEVRKRCLEPYFTTKTRRISSGLGLSLVKRIVETAGGELSLRTQPGCGTTFTLTLPAQRPAPERVIAPAVVTLGDPRRRAVLSHVLRGLRLEVHDGVPGSDHAGRTDAVWVTDEIERVPRSWAGRIVLMADVQCSPNGLLGERVSVLDPATPLPELRQWFRELLTGV